MRDPFSRPLPTLSPPQDSLQQRICENFQQLLAPRRIFPSSANGAPIHLPRWNKSPRACRAQSASLITHAVIITTLILLSFPARHLGPKELPPRVKIARSFTMPRDFLNAVMGNHSTEGSGSGGGRTPIPTTSGNLVPISSLQVVRPTLPAKQEAIMPVPPTILDIAAPPIITSVNKIGLPWMRDDTNSSGPGDSNTIGSGHGKTMGDGPIDGPGGFGDAATRYQAGVARPVCAYCPDPQYTDEAREAKLQGMVTLQVLVSADGRASQIRMVHGIGLGLDERAMETVRRWKFVPAQDAAHHAVPTWVTIEVAFRLI